jgi:hypothetical protein
MRSVRIAAVVLATFSIGLSFACGGKKPPKPPMTSDEPPKDDDADASAWGDDSKDGGSATGTPTTPPEPVVVACESKPATCAETKVAGEEIPKAKERCTGASGEPREGACSRDNVIATCEVADKNLTILTYAGPNAGQTKGRMKGAKGSCEASGGTFTPAPAAHKGGGKGAGKGGGKGPKKKK